MTVEELIDKLHTFHPNLRVVTAGFDESGADDITTVEIREIKFNHRPPGLHCGEHELAKYLKVEDGEPAVWIDF